MRIDGALPMHVARAYGVKPVAPTPVPTQVDPAQKVRSDGLVAATVNEAPELAADGGAAPLRANGAYTMYTRAADLVEAAVAVQVGRTLDLTA